MKRTVLLLSLCALFAVAAPAAFAQKGKPAPSPTPSPSPTPVPCPTDVNALQVVFTDGGTDLYKSDGGGPYVTTKTKGENLEILFQRANCTYDLTMNLNFSKRTTKLTLGGAVINAEFFNFDRVASVPVTQDTLNADGSYTFFTDSPFCNLGVKNDPATGKPINYEDGTAQDNYGGCRVDAEGKYYVLRSVGIRAESDSRGFRYQYSPIDGGPTWAEGTSYIRVYRPSANQWVLTPDADSGSWGRHYDKSAGTPLGDYSVPFSITVTRLN
jgi:hypothetical protein